MIACMLGVSGFHLPHFVHIDAGKIKLQLTDNCYVFRHSVERSVFTFLREEKSRDG